MEENIQQDQPVQAPPKPTNPMDKLTAIMLNLPRLVIVQNIKNYFAKFFKNSSEKSIVRTTIIIAVGLIIITTAALVGISFLGGKNPVTNISTKTPSPTVEANRQINPSQYADDEALLKIEDEVKQLNEDLNSSDLREVQLRIPTLDFEVGFK